MGAADLGIELNDNQLFLFQKYFDEMIDWNTRINLTSITGCIDVQEKHFLDSLTVFLALPQPIPNNFRIIDVGSGGGFPGIPLKIAFPQIELVLLESTGKKANFLKHLTETLALKEVRVLNGRAEEIANQPEHRETFDAVVARALAEMAALAELTLPFCRIGGLLVAQKKGEMADEIAASKKAISILGGGVPRMIPVHLPAFSDNRCLIVVNKLSATPHQFPRRSGMPSKRPLA